MARRRKNDVSGRSQARRSAIAHLHRGFDDGKFPVADLSGNRVEEYKADRLAATSRYGRAPMGSTINRELAILKRAFNLAAQADPPLVQKVPYIRMFGESAARSGFFEVAEFDRIIRELPEYLRAPLQVARMTGWRLASEVLTRRAKHLDLNGGWLRLDPGETKNGEGREFPLTPQLRSVLVGQRERTRALEKARGIIVPHLFHDDEGRAIGNFRGLWLGACKRAGIRKLPHDLRRTAVRNLERAGVPRSAAMKMVGHKTESIYRRYSIVDAKVLEEAAVKLALLQANEVASTAESNEMPIQKVGTDDEC
jgi:integrase